MKNIITICITVLLGIGMHYICACNSVENKNNKAENQQFYISGHILVPININGVNADFMLDNGSSTTYIDSAFFFSEILDSTFKRIHTKYGLESLGLFHYSGKLLIRIDEREYELNEFVVRNLHKDTITSDKIRKGIIGYDLLQDKVLMLDFINNTLRLNDNYSDTGYKKIPLIQSSNWENQQFIEAEVFSSNATNHKKGKFMFDLGLGGDAIALFKQKFLKSLEKDIEQTSSGIGSTGGVVSQIPQQSSAVFWRIDSINFSSFSVKDVKVATVSGNYAVHIDDQEGDGLLGCKFFDGFVIIVDFKKNLLFIKK